MQFAVLVLVVVVLVLLFKPKDTFNTAERELIDTYLKVRAAGPPRVQNPVNAGYNPNFPGTPKATYYDAYGNVMGYSN